MRILFLLIYCVFVFLMVKEVFRQISLRNKCEAVVGLLLSFLIVPDFIIFDAYNIPGTFIFVFVFVYIIPMFKLIFSGGFKIGNGDKDFIWITVIFLILGYALYTKYVMKEFTDYYNIKLFGYIYSFLTPMLIIKWYRKTIICGFDSWKKILLYAILAYAFKNFSLAGILNFRDVYLENYGELKNVIFSAQTLSIGVIICIYDLIKKYSLKTILLLGILLLQVLLFESRGPLISIFASTFMLFFFRPGKDKIRLNYNFKIFISVFIFLIIIIGGFKVLWDTGHLERIVMKAKAFSDGNRNETRYMLYPITIKAISYHIPWGVGFGNSKIAVMKINSYFRNDYPHNLILELLLEEGLIISVIIFYILLKWIISIFNADKLKCHTLLFFSLYVFFLICSMVSGDIVGNRLVFVFGYLCYHSKLYSKNMKSNKFDIVRSKE